MKSDAVFVVVGNASKLNLPVGQLFRVLHVRTSFFVLYVPLIGGGGGLPDLSVDLLVVGSSTGLPVPTWMKLIVFWIFVLEGC